MNKFCWQSDQFDTARFELHQLLGQPNLSGVPLLVVYATLQHCLYPRLIFFAATVG
jgi:hypothetical protein